MSGIFGFTYRNADERTIIEAISGLKFWNQIYGRTATDCKLFETSAIGCHIEHFSDRYSFGGPVLRLGGCSVVIDALIYNRDELFTLLELQENPSLSDEELLLLLIERQGFDSLAQVNGDFAGAMFNPDTYEWTLFRDHLGVRPLYVYLDNEIFAFSTDQRGIASLPGADCRVDEAYIYRRIAINSVLSLQGTEFANIRCALPAGITRVRMTKSKFELSEKLFWRIGQKKVRFRSDEAYRKELRRLITDAVHRRCDAVPGTLGAELSGGLDSGVIDILISRHGRELLCYSWSKDPCELPLQEGEDERKVVLDICAQEDLKCRFQHSEDILPIHKADVTLMPPQINTPSISFGSAWLKSQGANVVFSGHTGDEGVSHRSQRYELFYNREYFSYFRLFWQDSFGKRFRFLRTLKYGLVYAREHRKKDRNVVAGKHCNFFAFDSEFERRMQQTVKLSITSFNYAPIHYVNSGGSRVRLDSAAFQGALNGVRYLFPYADHRVMNFALSIPRRLFLNQTENRVIFRETFRDIMPDSLYNVRYKDDASMRTQQNNVNYEAFLKAKHEQIMSRLDPVYWKGILDLDNLGKISLSTIHDPSELARISTLFTNLRRCILIQDFQSKAQNWRELDVHNEIV